MAKQMTVAQLVSYLRAKQGNRTAKAFAVELGISAAYLSDVYAGRREPGDKILSRLNLERRVIYVHTV